MIKFYVKVLLAMREMTQKELAAQTGIRPPTISAICTGQAKHIPVDVLNRLCCVLDCQPGDIMEYLPEDGEQQEVLFQERGSAAGTVGEERFKVQEVQEPLTEKQQATILMDKFIDLQRIRTAGDREKEIEYQLRTTKAKLETLGVVTEELAIEV